MLNFNSFDYCKYHYYFDYKDKLFDGIKIFYVYILFIDSIEEIIINLNPLLLLFLFWVPLP